MIFVTRYSFITAILLSNLFFLFFIGLSRSNRVLLRIPLRVFALLGAALLVKLLFPIEVESTIEISSFQIYPAIIAFLGKKLFTIGGFVVQVRWLLLAVWMTGTVCIAWSRIRFYRQLVRRFGHLPSICDESYLKILEEVKRENGYAFETTVIVDKISERYWNSAISGRLSSCRRRHIPRVSCGTFSCTNWSISQIRQTG